MSGFLVEMLLIAVIVAVTHGHAIFWGAIAGVLLFATLGMGKKKEKALGYMDLRLCDEAVAEKIFATSPVLLGKDVDTPRESPYPPSTGKKGLFEMLPVTEIAGALLAVAALAGWYGFLFLVPVLMIAAAVFKNEGKVFVPSQAGWIAAGVVVAAGWYFGADCLVLLPICMFYPPKAPEIEE